MLTLMAGLLFDKTKDLDWLRSSIGLLEQELTYWLTNKTVEVKVDQQTYMMAHYFSESTTPRPESYKEDIITCNYFSNQDEKVLYFGKISKMKLTRFHRNIAIKD